MVSSGSIALLYQCLLLVLEKMMKFYCLIIRSTAHAPALLAAKVVLVDTLPSVPLLDVNEIEKNITPKTKAIIPVHLNGRACNMKSINSIADAYDLFVVEDSAQAFLSCNDQGQKLGTLSDIGCFSLSMCKLISSGQGGFCVTKDADLANKLREIRTHGVSSTFSASKWSQLGCNFRYNDILASIALSQILHIDDYINTHRLIDKLYRDNIKNPKFLSFDLPHSPNNIPIYHEFLVENQSSWIDYLNSCGVSARPFYPCLHTADYLFDYSDSSKFPHSFNFSSKGLSLPGGPHIPSSHVDHVIQVINARQH